MSTTPRKPKARTHKIMPRTTSPARACIEYMAGDSVASFVAKVVRGSVMELVEAERAGVRARLLRDMAVEMDIPTVRFYKILGVAKATASKKSSDDGRVTGMGGQAALNMAKLLGIANSIVANSIAKEAAKFDAAKWLGQWIERPQPVLGGKRPADLMDTPTGAGVVAKVLGAIESGAYQ